MKYIRTKDGRIVKIGEQTDIGYKKGTFEVYNKAGIVASYEPIEILKQAETIEELCDEFVLTDDNYCNDFYINHYYDDMIEVYREEKERCKSPYPYPRKPRILFGAIWTDRGLIYVAKMNEKGELELL